jgi:hypothetical protein
VLGLYDDLKLTARALADLKAALPNTDILGP